MTDLDKLQGVLGQASTAADAVAAETGHLLSTEAAAIPVALVNHSTTYVVSPALVPALQTQITRDFFQAWGILATLGERAPKAKDWALGIFDNADQAGALGYHETTPAGLPLGKVFVKVSQQAGVTISSVLSHELLEMLLDAYINLVIQDGANANRFWAYEVADAVEDTGYQINGVEVSNFVLPTYFEPALALPKPFDHLGVLSGPVPAMTPGGYMAYVENGHWGQVLGSRRAASQVSGYRGTSGRLMRRKVERIRSTYPMAGD